MIFDSGNEVPTGLEEERIQRYLLTLDDQRLRGFLVYFASRLLLISLSWLLNWCVPLGYRVVTAYIIGESSWFALDDLASGFLYEAKNTFLRDAIVWIHSGMSYALLGHPDHRQFEDLDAVPLDKLISWLHELISIILREREMLNSSLS